MKLSFIELLRRVYQYFLSPKPLISLIEEQLTDNSSVLDVGCGKNSLLRSINNPLYKAGIDFYTPYISKSKSMSIHNSYMIGNVIDLPIKPKSFDCAISIEVIEHLSKADGLKMISAMESVAKKRIILTTPNGFLELPPGPEDNPAEKHISGWTLEELKKLGFKVYGFNGFKILYHCKEAIADNPKTIFSFFIKIIITILKRFNKIVYYFPSLAFQLFFFKDIKNQ